jgi:endonuclease/exonuclease/phosphatase family metal-dependent hydrolase
MSPRTLGAALVTAVALTTPLALPAMAGAQSSNEVKVMTRNLYLGADLIPLAGAQNREEFEQAAAERYQTVLRNDFRSRAAAIAREVRRHKPDIIGLQEAARWLRGPEGIKDGPATPANQIVYDSTDVLLRAIRSQGLDYRVAVGRNWFDFEAPTALGFDVRLIQRDVILVRRGRGARVSAGNAQRGGFRDTFDVPTQVGVARQQRGWVSVDARRGNRRFRVVNTHLEAYSPEIGDRQMAQLLRQPLASRRRASMLIGDLNSDPRSGGTDDRGAQRQPSAYRRAINGGFVNPLPRRNTCCHDEDLRVANTRLTSFIDHILVRPRMRATSSAIVGSRPAERWRGLWPSDHAGIVATLRLR